MISCLVNTAIMRIRVLVLVLLHFLHYSSGASMSCNIKVDERIDCHPEPSSKDQEHCESRGCCFDSRLHLSDNVPWCFYPSNYPAYKVENFTQTPDGYIGTLTIDSTEHHPFGSMLNPVALHIITIEDWGLRIRLRDPNKRRYQVPIDIYSPSQPRTDLASLYDLQVTQDRFGIIVTRKHTDTVVFNTTIGPILFADQFLQISTALPSTYLYGLGERHDKSLISTNWMRNVYWAHDWPPKPGQNLYGDHPFYMCIENDGNAHGVFFLNSNAKEVATQPAPALTWRSIGGIFDLMIFLGPTPEMVAQQYATLVGKTFMPPMWSLGFQLSKWGYNNSEQIQTLVDKMRKANISQDVQWTDIDYMNNFLDFTYDKTKFKTLPQLVDNLHEHGQHYVVIVDPGISNQQSNGTYPPYDDGIASGIFIMDPENKKPIEGQVWPGNTVFPDFLHPNVVDYWTKQFQSFHEKIPIDGVLIDMNEPSNFVNGSTSGCPDNSLENPPYLPPIQLHSLSAKTLCVSALQYDENLVGHEHHYNLHSLTGLLEMKATSEALIRTRKKRPFVISRSTFSSAGKYGGHWSGDVGSNWVDLKQTVASVINFNLFGVPMMGAVICGFGGNATEELCTRWTQLGAFYPFSLNHNSIYSKDQAPTDFSVTAQANMRDILRVRYFYLPYLYSLFAASHLKGSTVVRGLFMEFPTDEVALHNDEQFMWGSGMLISPIMEEGATTFRMYYPEGTWYFLYRAFGEKVESKGQWMTYSNMTMSDVFLHARGGSILPAQRPFTTTTQTRTSPIILIVAPDQNGMASGTLYWDDGDTLGTFENHMFLEVQFDLKNNTLRSKVMATHEGTDQRLNEVFLFNASPDIQAVYLNGNAIAFNRMPHNVLHFTCSVSLSKSFEVQFK